MWYNKNPLLFILHFLYDNQIVHYVMNDSWLLLSNKAEYTMQLEQMVLT